MPAVRRWITRHAAAHPNDLGQALGAAFGVTRAAVAPVLQRLEQEAFVTRVRAGTRPVFAPGASRFVEERLPLPGLDESAVWDHCVSPFLSLPANVANIVHYGVTEMVNNANDHSDGRELILRCALAAGVLYLWVQDDGVGVFERISRSLGLADRRLAVLELSKGRVTTDPQHHTGEGIFFTSRAFPLFRVRANGLIYERRNRELEPAALPAGQNTLQLPPDDEAPGSRVTMAIRTSTALELRDLFGRYTTRAPDDLSFDRTVVPVRLARLGAEQLLSRSQAKRLLSGLERFRAVELDFEGVPEVGQAFADEVFRVWALANPSSALKAVNAGPVVAAMIRRAAPGAAVASP